jgi:hypothetical protein
VTAEQLQLNTRAPADQELTCTCLQLSSAVSLSAADQPAASWLHSLGSSCQQVGPPPLTSHCSASVLLSPAPLLL